MDMSHSRRKAGTFLAVLGMTGLLAGCAFTSTEQTVHPKDTGPTGFAPWSEAIPPYLVGPGDRLAVHFVHTPEMDEEALVAPDGTIALKVAEQIPAAGKSLLELDKSIAESSRWLRHPDVIVQLKEAVAMRAYVGGQVAHPGAYRVDGRIGVLEAILLAGGFSDTSRTKEVVLIRRNPDNVRMLRTINVQEFLENGSTANDVPLVAGDIIFVPRSRIGEVDLWVDQFINKALPFEKSANFTYSKYENVNPVIP